MSLKYKSVILRSMPFIVLKLGGSLIGCAKDLMRALFDLVEEDYGFLVVPGGGPMADLVRDLFSKYEVSQEAAHWMAILAMEQYAYFLSDGTGAKLTHKIRRTKCLEVLLPYKALLEDDIGLEHNWNYTSDSIAALVALRLRAPFIKATDVDGVILDGRVAREVSSSYLMGRESCIDQGTLSLLEGRCCWVLNGTDPNQFITELKKGEGGTIVRG